MSHSRIFFVAALGMSLWCSRSSVAQDFRSRGFLGMDLWKESATDYNPVTHGQMTVPDYALGQNRGPYMLTSTGQAPENPELIGSGDSGSACDSCCETPCESCCPCPCWTVLAEAIWLQRDRPTPFGVSFPGSNDPSILNTNDLNFRFAPGVRFTVSKFCGCNSAWEASYFGIDNWNDSASVTNPNRGIDSFLRVGIPNIPNFRNAFRQTITNGTDLYSFELNKRRFISNGGPWVASVLAGFRYIYIRDNLEFLSNDVDPAIDPTDIGLYTVKTTNSLVGGQIGGSLNRQIGDQFSLGFKLKAGLFANFAEQDSHLLNQQPNVPPSVNLFSHKSKTQLASVIETGAFGTWQFAQNWGIRGGYDVFIFSGLALAPAQLDFTANTFQSQPFINASETLVAHGPNVGIWHTW